uniref:Uncharacterized protein n=1 Tax=Knipowitschia caucasica TaxID=637954 RepID=A0AAV2MSF4_KNICA
MSHRPAVLEEQPRLSAKNVSDMYTEFCVPLSPVRVPLFEGPPRIRVRWSPAGGHSARLQVSDSTMNTLRLDLDLLRRFCSVGGYGWDYPDSEYRDIPLCFPEAVCFKLLLTLLTDQDFKLSPAGLVRVRQSIRSLQPVDELKKGLFQVRASVLVYRAVSGGEEVDIALSASSRNQSPVWESVLTLLSQTETHRRTKPAPLSRSNDAQMDLQQVDLTVPRFPTMPCFSLWRAASALCGLKSLMTPRLWMLSVCLAEIEKRRGSRSVTAPASVTVQFTEETTIPGTVQAQFWDSKDTVDQGSMKVCFSLMSAGSKRALMEGRLSSVND